MKNLLTYIALTVSALIVGYSLWATSQKVIANEPQVPISETSTNLEVKTAKVYDSEQVKRLVNIKRVEVGLNSLEDDEKLCPYTQKRLDTMRFDFSHDEFEATSQDYLKSRKTYNYLGENLADFYQDLSATHNESIVVSGWYGSPSHRANIIDKKYTHTCVRCDTRFCVQIFAGF